MNKLRINEIAGVYGLGFDLGYFRTKDLIRWADCMIGKYDNYNNAFVELSLSEKRHRLDIVGILKKIHGDKISAKSHDMIIALIARDFSNGLLDMSVVAKMLNRLGVFCGDRHWTDLLSNISTFEDTAVIKSQLKAFLGKYEKIANKWESHAQQPSGADGV